MESINAEEIIAMLGRAHVPEISDEALVEIPLERGWKAVLFYDMGSLDYIDHIVTPNGTVVDFWNWPVSANKTQLMDWRG